MTIVCDCSIEDGDGPEFCHDKIVKARKEHRCCECDEPIKPGQKYEYTAGLWDGYFCVYKTCMTCVRIREDFCPCGWAYGMLQETIMECIGLNYVTGELSGWAKKRDDNEN